MKTDIRLDSFSPSFMHSAKNRCSLIHLSSNYPFFLIFYVLVLPFAYLLSVLLNYLIRGYSFSDAFALKWEMFESLGSGSIFGTLIVISITLMLCRTTRVSFHKEADIFSWDHIRPGASEIRQLPISHAEAIVIPAQRRFLPEPAYIQFKNENYALEQRRPWRGNMDHIRQIADFTGVPLIEK